MAGGSQESSLAVYAVSLQNKNYSNTKVSMMNGAVAIIPARGGSKRIPRKNIKDFLGKPIIAYSIEAALSSEFFNEVMVSTDDEEIAYVSQRYGAKVPFFRSEENSSDMAMTVPVLVEVLLEYEKLGKAFNSLCCIYPCAPFVTTGRLTEGMDLLRSSGADCVLPVVKYSYPPQRCLVLRDGKVGMLHPENYYVRSQDLEPYYHDAGQFYCLKSSSVLTGQYLFGGITLPIVLHEQEVHDIDNLDDWEVAETKFRIVNSIE